MNSFVILYIATILLRKYFKSTEVGTNNIIPEAQLNKAQRSFQPVKAQRKMRSFIFLTSEALGNFRNKLFRSVEAQGNFRNKLFRSVEAQRNSAIAKQRFRTKLKRNVTSTLEISQHNANAAFLRF